MRLQNKDTESTYPETRMQGYQPEKLPIGELEVDSPVAGMVTSLPREQTPPTSWYKLRNARSRNDWVGRRPGTEEIGAKPDGLPILRLITFVSESGDADVLRLTPSSAYQSFGGGVWTVLTHDLTGAATRPSTARMFDWLFVANGEESIRVYRQGAGTFLKIPNAPRAKTITNFADRIIAANLEMEVGGLRPSGIAWSANGDPFDWTGPSSGSEDLVQGQDGYGDPIQGLFGLTEAMVILRKRSIWHAQRQPFANAPLSFQRVISGVGTDLPGTAIEIEGAIIFADQRTKSVYLYTPGSRPQKISGAIDKELFKDLQTLQWARGAYDPYEKEYHLGLCTSPLTPWITKTWVFSLPTNSWSFDDGPTVSEIGVVSAPAGITTIDELIGTIDAQVGTIDDLSTPGDVSRPVLYKGTPTGEFIQQSYGADTDWDGTAFEFEACSQNLGSNSKRRTFKDLMVKFITDIDTTITLDQSIDLVLWRNTKANNFLGDVRTQHARLPKKLSTGARLHWRIRCSIGSIRVYGYWVRLLEKGLQR